MSQDVPTLKEWQRLYEAAVDVNAAAPWVYMDEANVFGVQNPETKELGFVSVMGSGGEYYAVVVFLGAEGLYGFWDLHDADAEDLSDAIIEIPQLQVAFEGRDDLDKKDREIIKQTGLKFRGPQAWPMFRSYRPGFLPWHMEASEVRFMACALEQLLEITPRLKDDPSLLKPSGELDYLVRVPQKKGRSVIWQDNVIEVPPPEPSDISITVDGESMEEVMAFPRGTGSVEVDFFAVPAVIHEPGTRPFFPYVLLTVDVQTGDVFGGELMRVVSTLEEMWGKIPDHFVGQLLDIGWLPQIVTVSSGLLSELFQSLAEELHFTVVVSDNLPKLEPARTSLIEHLSNRMGPEHTDH